MPSCGLCEEAQRRGEGIFVRWKDTNIYLSACGEHLLEVRNAIKAETASAEERKE